MYLFHNKAAHLKKYSYETIFIAIIIFFFLSTIFISDYGLYLNHTLSNIYHFKTGHLKVQPDGWYQVKSIFRELGILGILFFPISIIFIAIQKKRDTIFIYLIIAIVFLIIVQFSGVRFFLKRNLNTVFVLMMLSYSLYLGELQEFFKKRALKFLGYILIFAFFSFNFYNNYEVISERSFSKEFVALKNLGVVDFSPTHFENAQKIQPMDEAYNLTLQDKNIQSRFDSVDNVIVKRINNNKQYTNYMLPLKFDLIKRKGDLFYFKRKSK